MKPPRFSTTIVVDLSFLFTISVKGCGVGHTLAHLHKRLPSSALITPPTRPLEWEMPIPSIPHTHMGGSLVTGKSPFLSRITVRISEFAGFVSHVKLIAKVSCTSVTSVYPVPDDGVRVGSRFSSRRFW